ncbi:MAG: precorrin-6y C5,15-methyltransferase (decarboxylating) subunit CbiE [Spirochaeta sp. LUC14_002_19_P3]|nr:MAG: precorrin-6y C5,15-methyltransferase (decarboxylating) subunit CbiE [Spirochaeta sp. LUC14_002_19_P3]
MGKFKLIGMGPGGVDYVLPVAKKALREAHVWAGAPRQLELAREICPNEEKIVFKYKNNLEELLNFIRVRGRQLLAVLVSGDPGFHSLLGIISRNFSASEYEVIPGVSSFQTAMARLGVPWQSDLLSSCHGRDFDHLCQAALDALRTGRRAIFLTDARRHPGRIAADLLEAGAADCPVWLAENVTLRGEWLRESTLKELAERGGEGEEWELCVIVVGVLQPRFEP